MHVYRVRVRGNARCMGLFCRRIRLICGRIELFCGCIGLIYECVRLFCICADVCTKYFCVFLCLLSVSAMWNGRCTGHFCVCTGIFYERTGFFSGCSGCIGHFCICADVYTKYLCVFLCLVIVCATRGTLLGIADAHGTFADV